MGKRAVLVSSAFLQQRKSLNLQFPFSVWALKSAGLQSSCFLEVGTLLLLLFPQVGFNLVPEEEHSQLAVRGLVHGLGLHAHAVLVWRQLVNAVFLVPQVEQTSGRRSDHKEVAVEVLPVQVDVLAAPSFDVDVKTSWLWEETSSIRRHYSQRCSLFWYANISRGTLALGGMLIGSPDYILSVWSESVLFCFFLQRCFMPGRRRNLKTNGAFGTTGRRVPTCDFEQHVRLSPCMFLLF